MFRQVAQRPGVAAPVIAAAQTYTTAVGTPHVRQMKWLS